MSAHIPATFYPRGGRIVHRADAPARLERKGRVFLSLAALVCLVATPAAASERGTTAADFLKIGMGASAAGLGEACTARSGDLNQIYYNPAGLENLPITTVSATHLNWIAETQYESLAIGRPIVGLGTLAAAFTLLHMPDIPALDASGADAGSLRVYDLSAQFAFAKDLSAWTSVNGLAGGASLKVLRRELAGMSATGVVLDLGGTYKIAGFALGLAAQNLGYLASFESASEQLPIQLRLGAGYTLPLSAAHRLLALADLIQPMDNQVRASLGLEYVFQELFSLRLGYKFGHDSEGLQAGAGVQWRNLGLDYALKTMGPFGLTHLLTASYGFGATVRDLQKNQVRGLLEQAEGLYSRSQYEESLRVVEAAVAVDPNDAKALHLQEKLKSVLDLLRLPDSGNSPDPGADILLTPDEREELVPKEVAP